MEIMLAIVVASAVIFFGALISMGNERQRKAIDELKEQVVLWAIQDIKIKRDQMAKTIQIPDPLGWLNQVAAKAFGYDPQLQIVDIFDEPQCIVCRSGNSDFQFVFSPLSPKEIRQQKSIKNNRLLQSVNNSLIFIVKDSAYHELSILSEGGLFDLELSVVWEALTSRKLLFLNKIWLYKFS